MSERSEKIRKKARAAYKAGEYEEAVTMFMRLADNRDEDEPLELRVADHVHGGIALARLSRHAEAVAEFEAAVALEPGNAVAQGKLGQELIRVGRPTQAFEALRTSALLAPADANVQWALAKVARALGEDQVADAAVAACLAADPDHEEAQMTLIARKPAPSSTLPGQAVPDSAFADLLTFVQTRPGSDGPILPAARGPRYPILNALAGSLGFMGVFLIVRFIMIG